MAEVRGADARSLATSRCPDERVTAEGISRRVFGRRLAPAPRRTSLLRTSDERRGAAGAQRARASGTMDDQQVDNSRAPPRPPARPPRGGDAATRRARARAGGAGDGLLDVRVVPRTLLLARRGPARRGATRRRAPRGRVGPGAGRGGRRGVWRRPARAAPVLPPSSAVCLPPVPSRGGPVSRPRPALPARPALRPPDLSG